MAEQDEPQRNAVERTEHTYLNDIFEVCLSECDVETSLLFHVLEHRSEYARSDR